MLLKLVTLAIVFVLLLVIGINLFVVLSTQSQIVTLDEMQESSYISEDVPVLVLGAGVIENRYPSKILQLRLDQALEINEVSANKAFIMSGDHREDNYNEVAVMKTYLNDRGLEGERIYLDHAGYSTYDSLYRLKHVAHEDQVIIVTQRYHLYRALLLAKYFGIEAIGIPAPESNSTRSEREFREILARLKDFAVVYLGYEPESPTKQSPFNLQDMSGDETNNKASL